MYESQTKCMMKGYYVKTVCFQSKRSEYNENKRVCFITPYFPFRKGSSFCDDPVFYKVYFWGSMFL